MKRKLSKSNYRFLLTELIHHSNRGTITPQQIDDIMSSYEGGDYVRLNYDINDISVDKIDEEILDLIDNEFPDSEDLKQKKLYVLLMKKETYYEVNKVTLMKLTEGIFMEAKYDYTLRGKYASGNIKGIRVDYTLDKYFVPENTGKQLEEKIRKGETYAKIKVYKGYSLLKEVVGE